MRLFTSIFIFICISIILVIFENAIKGQQIKDVIDMYPEKKYTINDVCFKGQWVIIIETTNNITAFNAGRCQAKSEKN